MPGGGTLIDSFSTRGDLPVRREPCAVPGCPERTRYHDEHTFEPLCGPHFRERRAWRAGSQPMSPRPGPAQPTINAVGVGTDGEIRPGGGIPTDTEIEMKTKPPCARPGCTRSAHAHGLCDTCRSRAKSRRLPLNRPLTAEELARLDVPMRKGPPPKAEPARVTHPNELRKRSEAEWMEDYNGVLDESVEALEILGLDVHGDYDYLGTLRELVAEREAVRKALVHPDGDQDLPLGKVAEGVAKQLQDEIQRLAVLAAKLEEAEAARDEARAELRAIRVELAMAQHNLAAAREGLDARRAGPHAPVNDEPEALVERAAVAFEARAATMQGRADALRAVVAGREVAGA